MAEKIKGITVQIGGDTSELSKALKDINKEINDTQKSLKDVENALKFDPANTELLTQKQKLLGEQVENTRTKLDALQQAQKQLEEQGVDKTSAQYTQLEAQIAKTKDSLSGLESEARKLNDVKLAAFQAQLESVKGKAQSVADATKGLSATAGLALGGITAAGISVAATADDLNTLAKQTGLATETLQEAKYAADLIDVSYETFTGSISKMTAKLRTSEDSFIDLGIATRDANGEFLGTEDIFWNAVQALSAMQNETERDIAAQQLFGKSAADLAGIIDDGGRAFRELGEDAKNAGLIMSQETLDGLNEVNDKLDRLKAQAAATLAESAAEALEALAPAIETVTNALSGLLKWIASLDSTTMGIIVTVLGVVAAISPIASIIAGIMSAIQVIIPIVIALNAAIAANPVVLVVAAATAAIVAIVALVVANWDKIKKILTDIGKKVTEVKNTIVQKITDAVSTIKALPQKALQWGKDLINNFIDGIKSMVKKLKDTVSNVANTVKDFLGFSEPKKGPLSNFHTYAPDMMELYSKGIEENLWRVDKALGGLLGAKSTETTMIRNYIEIGGQPLLDFVNDGLGVRV